MGLALPQVPRWDKQFERWPILEALPGHSQLSNLQWKCFPCSGICPLSVQEFTEVRREDAGRYAGSTMRGRVYSRPAPEDRTRLEAVVANFNGEKRSGHINVDVDAIPIS